LAVQEAEFVEDAEGLVAGEAIGSEADVDAGGQHFLEGVRRVLEKPMGAGAIYYAVGCLTEGVQFFIAEVIYVSQQEWVRGQIEREEIIDRPAVGANEGAVPTVDAVQIIETAAGAGGEKFDFVGGFG